MPADTLALEGSVLCKHDIYVSVNKTRLKVRNRPTGAQLFRDAPPPNVLTAPQK